jgi:2'-5' RNA ligase
VEKIRAFVAVRITDDVKKVVAEVEDDLKKAGADVKWVVPGNVHITLKFLGNIPADTVDGLARGLAEALRGSRSFEIVLAGTGTFPHGRRSPRVVWIGMEDGGDRLAEIAGAVEEACFRLGFEKEDRPFRPHLTIGRVRRDSGNLERLAERVAQVEFKPLKLEVNQVNLVRSKLSPRGPAYTVLESFTLERS